MLSHSPGPYLRSPPRGGRGGGLDHASSAVADDNFDPEADEGGPGVAWRAREPAGGPRAAAGPPRPFGRPFRLARPAGRGALLRLLAAVLVLSACAAGLAWLLAAVARARAPLDVVMFTNRQESALVVLRSIVRHCAQPERLRLHVVVQDAGVSAELSLYAARLRDTGGPAILMYTLGELTRELQEDGVVPRWALPGDPPAASPLDYVVRPAAWDDDAKHEHSLNHARFYIADMRFAQRPERLLFVDDDIVVQSDVLAAMRHRTGRDKALVVSCNAINFDPVCGWFHVGWNTMAYSHTSYFGFSAWNVYGLTQRDAVCGDEAQRECIRPGGFELLQRAALRINGARVDFDHKAWNFGFVIVELRTWRRLRLRQRYEAWLRSNSEERFFAVTSLGYGLGIPYLALHGAVECFDARRTRIVEGLAVMDVFDMEVSNVSLGDVGRADVLHYTGARKPWLPEAIPEFAAPFRRFDSQLAAPGSASLSPAPPPPRRLFVLLGGEHSGMEWAMATLDAHPRVCASGEGKDTLNKLHSFARHALMPPTPDMARSGLEGDWVARCSRQAMCTWRHVSWLATAGGDASAYALQHDVAAWRAFWAASGGNRSALFERFVRATLGGADAEAGLRLPCTCPRAASVVGFKFFDLWTEETHAEGWAAGHETPGGAAALAVLRSLGATFVSWERARPADAYVSLQKSLASGEWHCPTANCLGPGRAGGVAVDTAACRSYVAWHVAARARLAGQLAALGVAPERFVFEECMADQAACFARLGGLLGIDPAGLPFTRPRDPDDARRAVANYDAVHRECGGGGGGGGGGGPGEEGEEGRGDRGGDGPAERLIRSV